MTYHRSLIVLALTALAAAPAGASTLSVIYQPTDEPNPTVLLNPVPVKGGIIAGTNVGGQGDGDLFLLTPGRKGMPYTRTTIFEFPPADAAIDGAHPDANLVHDKEGNIWGTAGGNGANSTGTLYELVAPTTKGGAYTFRLVMEMPASFYHSLSGDGFDQLLFDAKGNLYGLIRGDINGTNLGAIFEVTKAQLASGSGEPQILYTFPTSDGFPPYGLARDKLGNFYGIEPRGGNVPLDDYHAGALWEVSPPAKRGGAYTEQIIHNFCSTVEVNVCVDGWLPMGGVAIGPTGTVYGTTFYEGLTSWGEQGNGTVWSAQPPTGGNGPWTFTTLSTLYSYNPDGTDGPLYNVSFPINVPVLTKAGQIVTTLTYGGVYDLNQPDQFGINGALLGVDSTSGATTIISNAFGAGNSQGGQAGPVTPNSGEAIDSAGNFYGTSANYTAPNGCTGTCTYGVIYKITP